ncbi:MAG: hypothetical protein U9N44_03115 [Chloroflexota bacterium]|nr:hypothetical protein [Chloroflexota bacterium]
MNRKQKTIAAVLAAVDRYEEEAAALHISERPRPIAVSHWKYYGIGEMMRARTTWQLRLCAPRSIQRR